MAISQTALGAALRRRFASPQAVLRALGIDEAAIKESSSNARSGKRGGLTGEHAVEIMDFLKDKLIADDVVGLNMILDRLLGETEVAERSADGKDSPATNGLRGAAMDRRPHRTSDADLNDFFARFPGTESIEPSSYGSDPRLAFDRRKPAPAPSESEMADFERRWPEIARIQV